MQIFLRIILTNVRYISDWEVKKIMGTGRVRGRGSRRSHFGGREARGRNMTDRKGRNKGRNRRGRRRNGRRFWILAVLLPGIVLLGAAAYIWRSPGKENARETPEELLRAYMDCIPEREYEKMYAMLDERASMNISQEDFVARNSAIYEGIEIQDLRVEVTGYDEESLAVSYKTTFDTVAGTISFDNEAYFLEGEEG